MRAMPYFLPLMLLAATTANPAGAAKDPPTLAWLSGHWCGGEPGEPVEESWLPARDEVMIGVSRTLKGERTTGFEYLRIVPIDGVATYFAQPGGRPATAFARTDGGADWVRFENPAHDFPRRIEYRRAGDGLHAEIAGPGDNGEEMVIGFDFVRCGH